MLDSQNAAMGHTCMGWRVGCENAISSSGRGSYATTVLEGFGCVLGCPSIGIAQGFHIRSGISQGRDLGIEIAKGFDVSIGIAAGFDLGMGIAQGFDLGMGAHDRIQENQARIWGGPLQGT